MKNNQEVDTSEDIEEIQELNEDLDDEFSDSDLKLDDVKEKTIFSHSSKPLTSREGFVNKVEVYETEVCC